MNNGENPDALQGGLPDIGDGSKSLFPFLTMALALLVGMLLGMLASWVLRPSPDEQLASARAEIAAQDDQIRTLEGALDRVDPIVRNMALHEQSIADGHAALDAREAKIAQREQELAGRLSIPKPDLSAQQVENFFERTDNVISRLFNAKDVPCPC